MKIEHWHCQDHYRQEQLNYGNLLGVCLGGVGRPRTDQYCDTRKGDSDLCWNPANPVHNVEILIRYLGDGTIMAANAVFNRELNQVLNLNHSQLRNNRKAVLEGFTQTLPRSGTLAAPAIQRKIDQWVQPSRGDLHPFCMVVVYWLRKRLARI